MKTLTILYIMICGSALAFDPVVPPPTRNIEWTARTLAHGIIPLADFDAVPILDALAFAGRVEIPKEYRVIVKVSDEAGVRDKLINIKAKNIMQIEFLAAIAEQAGLDMLIQPGVVVLTPRAK